MNLDIPKTELDDEVNMEKKHFYKMRFLDVEKEKFLTKFFLNTLIAVSFSLVLSHSHIHDEMSIISETNLQSPWSLNEVPLSHKFRGFFLF